LNEAPLPDLTGPRSSFDTLGIRKLLAAGAHPFVTYYTDEPEVGYQAYLTLPLLTSPTPLPEAGRGS